MPGTPDNKVPFHLGFGSRDGTVTLLTTKPVQRNQSKRCKMYARLKENVRQISGREAMKGDNRRGKEGRPARAGGAAARSRYASTQRSMADGGIDVRII